jgi:hypothetical protein
MRRSVPLALLLLALAPLVARAEEDPKARQKRLAEAAKAKAEEDRRFAEAVNGAIDRGAKWLEKQQGQDGSFGSFEPGGRDKKDLGLQALALLTLAKCGADEKDPAIQKGMRHLRLLYDGGPPAGWDLKGQGGLMTYSVASMILFYEALYNPPAPVKAGERYAAPKKRSCRFPKEVEEIVRFLVSWLVEKQEDQVWRYPGGTEGNQDLSNTQYALLALQAAARCGIEAPANVYKRALQYLLEQQQKDGPETPRWIPNPAYDPGGEDRYGPFLQAAKDKARGWAYLPNTDAVSGSMTTAGIAGLSICRDRLRAHDALDKDLDKRIERSLLDGCAWLGRHFKVDGNPGTGGWHYYYLYGLERAGAMTGLVHFGQHDWYREGAQHLLGAQQKDGGWAEVPVGGNNAKFQNRTTQTCFALLFLRRATVPPALPVGPVVTGGD